MKVHLTTDHLWLGLKYFLIALFFGVLIRGFILIPVPVTGDSMAQNLNQGDMIVMEKYSRIKRFDVIVFRKDDGTTYIKRVIGLPGDTIVYEQDQLFINDEKVPEGFLTNNRDHDHEVTPYTTNFHLADLIGTPELPENEYFVMGDNRRISKDSRSFGTVDSDEVLGKARLVYYPLRHLKFIH
ncbi:signal peptidase I [Enterococcus florum]|uniref:Signal peptidase I n=1 Tax=Enterococcus florum TaxID=2480627 RepID=A0A4P5P9B1_9ENTE|nr:signal peptidase I [Enterococcus florum]GCF92811.1 signal peptidase I [Enterococcus florum]